MKSNLTSTKSILKLPVKNLSFDNSTLAGFKKIIFFGQNFNQKEHEPVNLQLYYLLGNKTYSEKFISYYLNYTTKLISYKTVSDDLLSVTVLRSSYEKQKSIILSFYNQLNTFFAKFSKIYYKSWLVNLYFIGVGYKVFIYNQYLYIRLGFSKMLKLEIPSQVGVLTRRRNHLRLFSSDLGKLSAFVKVLTSLRSFDKYKGKGIYQYSDFSQVKLKTGKKQQFF